MTINELREKRNQAWEGCKGICGNQSATRTVCFPMRMQRPMHRWRRRFRTSVLKLSVWRAMAAMDAQLSKPTSAPITEKPMNGKAMDGQKAKTGRASDAYKDGMLKALRTNFRNVSNVLQEGVDADGGYLVPEEYDTRLIEGIGGREHLP